MWDELANLGLVGVEDLGVSVGVEEEERVWVEEEEEPLALSVLANGEPNHSLLPLFCDRGLVHLLRDNPNPPPSLDTPPPPPRAAEDDTESLDEFRKRLLIPIISSLVRLNPEEAGAIVDEERRRKGLNKLLGFTVHEDEPPDFFVVMVVDAVAVVAMVEQDAVGVAGKVDSEG